MRAQKARQYFEEVLNNRRALYELKILVSGDSKTNHHCLVLYADKNPWFAWLSPVDHKVLGFSKPLKPLNRSIPACIQLIWHGKKASRDCSPALAG